MRRIVEHEACAPLYDRPAAPAPWQLLRSHAHPEFPATLQVAAMAYSNPLVPSIELWVEEIAFEP